MSQIDNFDAEFQNANANSETQDQAETTVQTTQEAEPEIDYRTKFSESSKEALRLLEEKKQLEREKAELEALLQADRQETESQTTENLFPGFEELDEEAKINLINYTNTVTQRAKDEIYKDPAITFARRSYNEKVWDSALDKVLQSHPELSDHKDEFKTKYFNVNNVPQNIEEVLGNVAKIYLFDKAKELGAQEERQRSERVESERNTGGDRNVSTSRSIEEWQQMAINNPAKFALLSKEYQADMESGKLRE